MPAFKFNTYSSEYEYAIFNIPISTLFFVEASSAFDLCYLGFAPPSLYFEFEVMDIPQIMMPSLIFEFEGRMQDESVATLNLELIATRFDFLVSESSDHTIDISIVIPKLLIENDVFVPALNETKLFLSIAQQLYFDVYVPIICNLDVTLPGVMSAYVTDHPVFMNMDLKLKAARFLLTADHLSTDTAVFEIPSLMFNFFIHTESVNAEMSLNFRIPHFSFISADMGEYAEFEIIKFDYEAWMFEILKENESLLSEEDVISFKRGLQ